MYLTCAGRLYRHHAAQYDLRYDPKRSMVVAPYRDVFNRLAGARGRSILDGPQKHYDYTYQSVNNAQLCWYNEPVLNLHGPVVVVEGQFDCWKTVQAFPKTVANLTAKPTMEKMKKLGDCGVVIQIPDRDEAGQGKRHSVCQALSAIGTGASAHLVGRRGERPGGVSRRIICRERIAEQCN